MKTSYNWLKEYLHTDLSTIQLGDLLTEIGLEVEGIETVESIKGGLRGIVIGEVITCERHPNADRLSVTTVNIGQESVLHIVCGAPNVAAGQKVLVATEGAEVFGKDGLTFTIKKGVIRGEASEGMICAEDELGMGTSHEGILILPKDAEVGIPAAQYYKIETDTIFEIGLTPNRSDATCHLGVAKDLYAAIKFRELGTVDLQLPDLSKNFIADKKLPITVEVLQKEACPRYTGIVIDNITVTESPDWLKNRLKSIGQKPINNIVDITNFILHELGQALHAFDYDKIKGAKILVKTLANDTLFIALDGTEKKLSDQDLMICDANSQPMCIAGVFGGKDSGVSENTKRIFLESAYFSASGIRKTSTRHMLRTEAAKCFEKGADPNNTKDALIRAIDLIQQFAGGHVASELIDIYDPIIKLAEVKLHYRKVSELVGINISEKEIKTIIQLMGMKILFEDKESVTISVPSNKADVKREVDVIEEILRIYGLNNLPVDHRLSYSYNNNVYPDPYVIKTDVSKLLVANGFYEIMSLSLTQSSYFDKVLSFDKSKLVYINNTGNISLDVMRPNLLISGLEAIQYNQNRQNNNLRLFEFGRAYKTENNEITETEQFALFITGKRWPESWMVNDKDKLEFYDIKSYVHLVLSKLGLSSLQETEFIGEELTEGLKWHRGPLSFAYAGKVKHSICQKMDIKADVWYAIIDWKNVLTGIKKQSIEVTELNKFPIVRRDLALIVEKSIKFADIAKIANKAAKPLLKEVNLFDVYENQLQLGEGKKSYAVGLVFEQNTGTLKDEDVDVIISDIIETCKSKLGAIVRS